jgi:hypothetical protein
MTAVIGAGNLMTPLSKDYNADNDVESHSNISKDMIHIHPDFHVDPVAIMTQGCMDNDIAMINL